jgi:hypothetical protein
MCGFQCAVNYYIPKMPGHVQDDLDDSSRAPSTSMTRSLLSLPDETLVQIFEIMDARALARLCSTSPTLNACNVLLQP